MQLTYSLAGSDGCTYWLDLWYRYCCDAHDLAYGAGALRLLADMALEACVASSGYDPLTIAVSAIIAPVMFWGVRLFGGRFYKRAKERRSKEIK